MDITVFISETQNFKNPSFVSPTGKKIQEEKTVAYHSRKE